MMAIWLELNFWAVTRLNENRLFALCPLILIVSCRCRWVYMHAGRQHKTLEEKILITFLSSSDVQDGNKNIYTVHENSAKHVFYFGMYSFVCTFTISKYSDVRATS